MRQNQWQSLRSSLSANAVPGVLALKATVFMTLALNGWSDGRDHFPALVIALALTGMLLFCLQVVMVRSREARRLATLGRRNLRRVKAEAADGRSKLRSVSQIQWERSRDAGRLRAAGEARREALLQERAKLPVELGSLEGQIQTALERFKEEAQMLRTRSVNAFRTTLGDLRAIAALRHRLQPRVCGVRFDRNHSLRVTKGAEEEFLEAVDRLIASQQPKQTNPMNTPTKPKPSALPLVLAALAIIVLTGCDKLKTDQQVETRPPARLVCITLDSPDLLAKCGEIALAVAGGSVHPGDRIVILDAARNALVDCSVHEPEWLEPLGDVRRRFRRELENAIADIETPAATADAERFSQGHLMLHIQREFSNVSAPDKILVMVSKTFSTFATVDAEDLAVYGPEEIIEDLGARGMVSDLAGFRVFRTGPASGDIKMDQLYDKLWSAYFRQSGVEDYRRVGWESAVSEIKESVTTKGTL